MLDMRRIIFVLFLAFLALCLMGCSTISKIDDNTNTTTNDTTKQITDNTHTHQDLQTGLTSKQ